MLLNIGQKRMKLPRCSAVARYHSEPGLSLASVVAKMRVLPGAYAVRAARPCLMARDYPFLLPRRGGV